jgi:hypothetical protein
VRYLGHLRDAWNHLHPDADLAAQEVTVTVPASFDPAARELTAEAAQALGLDHLVLLEEPQAALYSWIHESAGEWRNQVRVGDMILVIDVGGGTTDLSLIAVTEREGSLELTRVAVGDHILLGGDNMDLALAHVFKGKLSAEGKTLDAWQVQALTHGCRQAKETLLMNQEVEAVPVVVPSRGTRLIGGSIRTELTREEVRRTLVEGFFPRSRRARDPPPARARRLTKLGLPYAQDPAVTRHLAAFLGDADRGHRRTCRGSPPWTGKGVAAASCIRRRCCSMGASSRPGVLAERVLDVVNDWLASDGAPPARLLGGVTWTSPWPAGPPTTAMSAGAAGCASAAAPPAPTTSGWRAPCPRCRGWSPRSRPCAWPPSAWRRAPRRRSRPRSSAWWWGSRCASASSAPPCAATIRWGPAGGVVPRGAGGAGGDPGDPARRVPVTPARWSRCACGPR